MEKKKKKISLSTKTLIGMIAGAIIGFIVGPEIVAIKIVGDIFLRMLQMVIVPLILFSVITAIASMGDLKRLGRIGSKLIVLFMGTTLVASVIGIIAGKIFNPGKNFILKDVPPVDTVAEAPNVSNIITNIIPTNIMQAMSEGNMLQVIAFAIFSGIAILLLKPEDRERLNGTFQLLSRFVMKILNIVIATSPYGVFALMAVTAGQYGPSVIGPLTQFIGTLYFGLIVHVLIAYFGLYFLFTRKNPFLFFKKITPVWMTAATTCSSKATMPVSIQTCEKELKLPKDVVGLTIPVGASMNMDGNALWFGAVAIFVSQIVGVTLSVTDLFMAAIMGVLMTLGSPGIPGGIFVATAIFLKFLGLPLEVIGLLAGMFRIVDMGITTANVVGSVAVAAIVGDKDIEKFQAPSTTLNM